MASRFEKILKEARQKGEAKLKVIAPKLKTPTRTVKTVSGGGGVSSLATPTKSALQLLQEQRAAQAAAAAKAAAEKKLIEETRRKGLAELKRREEAARKRISRQERLSIIAREEARIAAQVRGKGFTRRELSQFIKARGGSVTALRSATRKGFRIARPAQVKKKIKVEEQKQIKTQSSIIKRQLQELPKAKKLGFDLQKIKTKSGAALDFISAGFFTERKIDNDEEKLTKDIDAFNNKYEGKQLTESEFAKATSEASKLTAREQNILERRDALADSFKSKAVGRVLNPFNVRLTSEEKKKLIQSNAGEISKEENRLKQIDNKLKKQVGKKGALAKLELKRLKLNKKNTQENIKRLKQGESKRVIAGDFPIIPASQIPKGVQAIKFVGTQKKGKGGKIITDIVFQTDKGRVGLAKGVGITKGKFTSSIVLGRSGKVAVKLPKGKKTVIGIQSFIGLEKAGVKPVQLATKSKINILKNKKKLGVVTKIKKNINALRQTGVGQVATIRGKKFLKAGKIKKGINIDDFASMSAVFTKKELSLIIGKTISPVGAKTAFIGLIKGTGKASGKTFSSGQKAQFNKALQKVANVAAASLNKAEKVKGATKATSIVTAVNIASGAVKASPRRPRIAKPTKKPSAPKTRTIKTKVVKPTIVKTKTRLSVKGKSVQIDKQRIDTIQKAAQKAAQLEKQKAKQIQKLKQKLTQKQKLKQAQKLRQVQRQLQKLKTVFRIKVSVPRVRIGRTLLRPIPIPKKKKIIRKNKPTKKEVPVFNVFGRARGKFVKLNRVPLTKKDALSKGAFAIDRTTARTFKIESAGRKAKPGKLLKKERNYFNRQGFKLREVRFKKGRKFKLKEKYIEKRKHAIDTRSEKGGLTIAKLLKQRVTPAKAKKILKDKKIRGKKLTPKQQAFFRARAAVKPIKKRKITTAQRKQLLKNLKKARRVKKMKGGKKK